MADFGKPQEEIFTSPYAALAPPLQRRTKRISKDRFRTPFQRDIHRIIYSQPFRRLRHKTQVFFFPRNDHICTRMEHVFHVSSAARTVARSLGLNEDLAEAVGLAHDIGHPPFGHIGEMVLDKIVKAKKILPNFHHEIYGLRVVDKIAELDREPAGLNLTFAVRDGIISHCGEPPAKIKLIPYKKEKKLEEITSRKQAHLPVTLEGCIVHMVDKIVYLSRDIEDAFATNIIAQSDIPAHIIKAIGKNSGDIIGTFLEDLIENSNGKNYIALSPKYGNLLKELITFNYANIYNSDISRQYNEHAKRTIQALFDILLLIIQTTDRFTCKKHNKLNISLETTVYQMFRKFVKKNTKTIYNANTPDGLIVLDFVAGMTDQFAVRCFQELFIPQPPV